MTICNSSTPSFTVVVTKEMLNEATLLIPGTRVFRTVASKVDTLTGHIGEFAFAEYFFGDWRKNRVGKNRGETDFDNIEIKTSAYPFSEKLNLLVREDYAERRKPAYYVQIIIDVPSPKSETIPIGTHAYICGFASAAEVDKAPLRDFGSKLGGQGGYRCHYIQITNLRPVSEMKKLIGIS